MVSPRVEKWIFNEGKCKLVIILIKINVPYETPTNAIIKMSDVVSDKFPRDSDIIKPNPIQPYMSYYSNNGYLITVVYEVRKGKFKEAIDFFNRRKHFVDENYALEGYKYEICVGLTSREGIQKEKPTFARNRSLLFRKKQFLVFLSYATKDTDTYKIHEIAKLLRSFPEIKDVIYWQEHMHDNIFKFMNDKLENCDVMLLFCSEKAIISIPVEKEWTAAEAINLPIIPIFFNADHIPTLLKSRLGIEYDFNDLDKNIREIRNLIFRKIGGVVE